MEMKEIQRLKIELEADLRKELAGFTLITGVKVDSVTIESRSVLSGRNDYKVGVRLNI